jgi:cytochrome c peroxidase
MARAHKGIGAVLLSMGLMGCVDDGGPRIPLAPESASADVSPDGTTPALVRALAASRGIGPLQPAPFVRPALAELGRLLLFDKVLSGNRDIACATCHLPAFGTGDGLSLSVGQGGHGFGPGRRHPAGSFIPRNAPPLFNLGAMRALFWDGRIESGPDGAIHTPAGAAIGPEMRSVFEFGPISALAMFPVMNRAEMRADQGNELAEVPDNEPQRIWSLLMGRLGAIPEYRRLFADAYPGRRFEQLTFAHASNAIAGFVVSALTHTGAPWDHFLAGNDRALSPRQLAGARTFLSLKCSICHNGPTFSDNQFHNVAVAQVGPGQGDGPSGRDDFGRMRVTGDARDQYRFRTTALRNVELTGPWGHDGTSLTLRGFIDHYSESDRKLRTFDPSPLHPALRGTLLPNADAILATRDTLLEGVVLTEDLIDQLTAFMGTLTDPAARRLGVLTPGRVPSGIPMDGARDP